MKHKSLIFILLAISKLFSGVSQNHALLVSQPHFNVTIDTFYLDLQQFIHPTSKVALDNFVKYGDKYYCIFREWGIISFDYFPHIYFGLVLSEKGEILHRFPYPHSDNYGTDAEMFIYNNSIFTCINNNCFCLDTNKLQWIPTHYIDKIIYEDKSYQITYSNYGEWGACTWFFDKTRNDFRYQNRFIQEDDEFGHRKWKRQEYDSSVYYCQGYYFLVNKIETTFYLTRANAVIQIDNIRDLPRTAKSLSYHVNRYRYNKFELSDLKVANNVKLLYKYKSKHGYLYEFQSDHYYPSSYRDKLYIVSSFPFEHQLYHIYFDKGKGYFGTISNDTILPVSPLPDFIKRLQYANTYRRHIEDNQPHFLRFANENNYIDYGMFVLDSNMIQITYIKHDAETLAHLGLEKSMQLFAAVFDEVLKNIDSLPLKQIVALENSFGATNTKRYKQFKQGDYYYHTLGDLSYQRKVAHKELSTYFVQVQDTLISNTVKLHSEIIENDTLLTEVVWIWEEEYDYQWRNPLRDNPENKKQVDVHFQNNLEQLMAIITERLGTPLQENDNKFIWHTANKITVELNRNTKNELNKIRIVMYKTL